MKTQTTGLARSRMQYPFLPMASSIHVGIIFAVGRAKKDYRDKRLNGDEKNDTLPSSQPEDGSINWVKGEVEGKYVYGVRYSYEHYEYECRYDEGAGDRRWMAECDRNYLARLHLLGTNSDQERQDLAENRERAAKAAEEIGKLPEEQLSAALKKFYITVATPRAIYEVTPFPTELIAITMTYLTEENIGKEIEEVKSAITLPQVTDDASRTNGARQSGSISVASNPQNLWSQSTQALFSSSSGSELSVPASAITAVSVASDSKEQATHNASAQVRQ